MCWEVASDCPKAKCNAPGRVRCDIIIIIIYLISSDIIIIVIIIIIIMSSSSSSSTQRSGLGPMGETHIFKINVKHTQ